MKKTTESTEEKVKKVRREVTQADLDLNPELVEQGVEIGDIMKLPPAPEPDEAEDEDIDEEEPDEDSEEEDEEDESVVKAKKTGSVSFKIKNDNDPSNISVRAFSVGEHGKNYKELADSFEQANTLVKITPEMTAEEKEEVSLFNKTVKHPIISKEVSE